MKSCGLSDDRFNVCNVFAAKLGNGKPQELNYACGNSYCEFSIHSNNNAILHEKEERTEQNNKY